MKDTDSTIPLLHLMPIEAGEQLKVYAVNLRRDQPLPPCHCDGDIYFSVQQGVVRIYAGQGTRMLQPRESEFLAAGQLFRLEALTDARAQLVMPAQARLVFADH